MRVSFARGRGCCCLLAVACALLFSAVSLAPISVEADARSDYLVKMLQKGGSYRVRVQAATTLGKIRSLEAVPALIEALEDSSKLVVIAAATALGQIGDISAIARLEKVARHSPSKAAKSQVNASLRILRALSPEGDTTALAAAKPQFLVKVDVMGDSSGAKRDGTTEKLRQLVADRVSREPGVELQKENLSNRQVKSKLKRKKLTGYVFSGAILRMERVGSQVVIKIALNVFSNPDYSLLMMPTAQGSLGISGAKDEKAERKAEDRALKAITDSLVASVFKVLREPQ